MNATDYKIRKIEVLRDRYQGTETPAFDITRAVAEINIFESIYVPYLTGSLTVVDTSAISSMINFQGQEEITIDLEVGGRNIRKEFVVYSVPSTLKSLNDSSSTYNLDLIEKHAYKAAFRQLRASYSGKIEDVIKGVLEEDVNILEESDQHIKVLGCNRSPVEMTYWLLNRATSSIGEPMFCYSTINNGLTFTSLGEMLNRSPLEDIVFRYSQLPYSDVSNRFLHEASTIQSMKIGEQDNMIEVAKQGAVRSRFFNIDTLTRSVDHIDFKASEYFDLKKENGKVLYDQTLFDQNFSLDDEVISNAESRYVTQINTSQMYKDINAYDEDALFSQKFKLSRHSDLVLLNRERFEILLPGYYALATDEDTTVGTVINISVPKDQPAYSESDLGRIEDKKRSGKFLVTNCRHIFDVDGVYRVSLSIGRTESPDAINTASREDNEKRPR